ncbi:MAG: hypothetical protein U0411_02515 [Thermodesulfovibrionales bacterium]
MVALMGKHLSFQNFQIPYSKPLKEIFPFNTMPVAAVEEKERTDDGIDDSDRNALKKTLLNPRRPA